MQAVRALGRGEFHPENGSGAMTVFERSRADVSRCTFTGNWAGVDDNGTGSTYVKSIFWNNTLNGAISTERATRSTSPTAVAYGNRSFTARRTICGGRSIESRTPLIRRIRASTRSSCPKRRSTERWATGRRSLHPTPGRADKPIVTTVRGRRAMSVR